MKVNKWIIVLCLLSLAVTAWFFRQLPEEIPLHFNVSGKVDNLGSRNMIWLAGILPLLIYFFMFLIPKIDPKKQSYEKHRRAYSIIAIAITLFFIALNQFILFYALGYGMDIQIFIGISIGLLFLLIGNYLPTARQNYSFGIKTPWTLANESSWTKTHRAGGFGFVITGIIILLSGFFEGISAFIIMIAAIFLLITILTVYSYLVFKKSSDKTDVPLE